MAQRSSCQTLVATTGTLPTAAGSPPPASPTAGAARGPRRRGRTLLLLLLVATGVPATAGCQLFQRTSVADSELSGDEDPKPSTKKRKPWYKSIVPPKGEYFFDERSHAIEESLRKKRPQVDFD